MNELIKIVSKEKGVQTISAKELYLFLGMDKSQWSRWAKRNIEDNEFVCSGEDWVRFDTMSNGNPTVDYEITLDFAKRISMMARTEKGEKARSYFIECERKLKELVPASYLIVDPIERAKAWIKEQEQLKLAIATKAEIGSRREATAMATASLQAKRANDLAIKLDESKEYCTVKRMELLTHGQKFNWRLLKSTGIEMRVKTKDVFDANYGTVKAYHKSVWKETYNLTF